MGEWSEYFEDFPEENPANQKQEPDLGVMSIVFPHLHLSQLTKAELAVEVKSQHSLVMNTNLC